MQVLMTVLKWVVGIALIPAVVAATNRFLEELSNIGHPARLMELGGIVYVVLNLFFCRLEGVYQVGQKIFIEIFKFNTPLAAVVPRIIPLWTIVVMLVYFFLHRVFDLRHFDTYLQFFMGLTFVMHLVLTAQQINKEDGLIIKPHYLCAMGLTYIALLAVAVGLLDALYSDVSLVRYLKHFGEVTLKYYGMIFRRMM